MSMDARRALDNSQSLLAMIYHLGTAFEGPGIAPQAWKSEDLAKMLAEQIAENRATLDQPQAVATPAFDALATEVIDRISERYNKLAASPLGMATAWERKASGGKPLLYGGKRGLLASGTIATWDEFDLIADVINNLPTLLAACSRSKPPRSEGTT